MGYHILCEQAKVQSEQQSNLPATSKRTIWINYTNYNSRHTMYDETRAVVYACIYARISYPIWRIVSNQDWVQFSFVN